MNETIAAVMRAMPPEQRQELRALLRAAGTSDALSGRKDHPDRDDADRAEDAFDRLDANRPVAASPLPPLRQELELELELELEEEADRYAADRVMLADVRRAGGTAHPAAPPASSAARHAPAWDSWTFGRPVQLSEVAPRRIRWLSPGRLAAGKLTVLDGDPGSGKSTLLCELAARLTRGEALPGGRPGPPRTVILLSAEDDLQDTIRPRLEAAGGDARCVVCFTTVPDGTETGSPFVIPGDVGYLELVVRRAEAALVIIDPLLAFLDRRFSASRDQEVRRALARLQAAGARTGAAIVVVRHLTKSTAANPLYRGGGSIGIIGAARCGLLLTADPDDAERRILAVSKTNLTEVPASLAFRLQGIPGRDVARVVWEGESHWTAGELLRAAKGESAPPSAVEEIRAWLHAALATGPQPAQAMHEEAAARGFSLSSLKRARRVEGIVVCKARTHNGGWTWELPDNAGEGAHATSSLSP